MQLAPTITFRGVKRTTALETEILRRVRLLDTYYRGIMRCRVAVEFVQRHHEAGNRYRVRLELTVPGEEIVVSHEAGLHATAQDVEADRLSKVAETDPERKHARVAIREAFDIARRQLQDYARRQRGAVKTAARQRRGRVSQLFPVDQYGYIEAEDGHQVYFQKNSVLKDAFERLAVDSSVSFVEENGEKGPQASTVKLLHPRRVHHRAYATTGGRIVR
jgi:cold shock CspA family protein/ribosome-associated translation inhibitor RaiA